MQRHGRDIAEGGGASREESKRGRDTSGSDAPGSRILDRISAEVGPEGYRRYFEHQTRVNIANGRVQVTVPTGFVADLLGRRFGESLRRAAGEELGGPAPDVAFRIDRSAFGDATRTPGRMDRPAPGSGPRQERPTISPRYRLEDFEVGESNQLAHAAAMTITEERRARSANLLFVHGPCGVGKTHLLQGVALRVREQGGAGSVVYTTAEAFTNEYIMAVQGNRLDIFRKRYRGVSLLCIDDVQFFQNKHATQTELMHTFDAIDIGGARVVLASDEHPRKVQRLSQALVSRFMAGMVVRVEPPEPALRAKIVARLAAKRGLNIDPAGASLIAARCAGPAPSARDIEGVLSRIEAIRALPGQAAGGGPVGLVLIRRALGVADTEVTADSRPVRPVRMTLIIEEVCRVLRVEASELFGKGRHKRVVLARSACAVLGRALTTMSYPEIARALGRPNHSTVVTAVKRLEGQMEANAQVGPSLGSDLDGVAGTLAGLSVRMLVEQLRSDILRSAPGA